MPEPKQLVQVLEEHSKQVPAAGRQVPVEGSKRELLLVPDNKREPLPRLVPGNNLLPVQELRKTTVLVPALGSNFVLEQLVDMMKLEPSSVLLPSQDDSLKHMTCRREVWKTVRSSSSGGCILCEIAARQKYQLS